MRGSAPHPEAQRILNIPRRRFSGSISGKISQGPKPPWAVPKASLTDFSRLCFQAAMWRIIGVTLWSTIPGWTIFQTSTVFPKSTPGTKRRKPILFWRQSNSLRRPHLLLTRRRRGLPVRNGRPRANLARGSPFRAMFRGARFSDPLGGKEAVCRNM